MGAVDPVEERRALIGQRASQVRRIGYGLWGIAVVIFFFAFATDFTPGRAQTIVALLIIGSILLLPAIILGYGVKAADRDEARARRVTQQ